MEKVIGALKYTVAMGVFALLAGGPFLVALYLYK